MGHQHSRLSPYFAIVQHVHGSHTVILSTGRTFSFRDRDNAAETVYRTIGDDLPLLGRPRMPRA